MTTMIKEEDLRNCIGILSEIYTLSTDSKQSRLIIEAGAILQGALTTSDTPKNISYELMFKGCAPLSASRENEMLLADNKQLFQENQMLINDINLLKTKIIGEDLPSIKESLNVILKQYHELKNMLNAI